MGDPINKKQSDEKFMKKIGILLALVLVMGFVNYFPIQFVSGQSYNQSHDTADYKIKTTKANVNKSKGLEKNNLKKIASEFIEKRESAEIDKRMDELEKTLAEKKSLLDTMAKQAKSVDEKTREQAQIAYDKAKDTLEKLRNEKDIAIKKAQEEKQLIDEKAKSSLVKYKEERRDNENKQRNLETKIQDERQSKIEKTKLERKKELENFQQQEKLLQEKSEKNKSLVQEKNNIKQTGFDTAKLGNTDPQFGAGIGPSDSEWKKKMTKMKVDEMTKKYKLEQKKALNKSKNDLKTEIKSLQEKTRAVVEKMNKNR